MTADDDDDAPISFGRKAPAPAAELKQQPAAPIVEDDDDFPPVDEERFERERDYGGFARRDEPAKPSVRLPANVEAEAALLGAMMIDNRIMEAQRSSLQPAHFFEPLHARVYEAMLKMLDASQLANPITLRPLFDGDAQMEELGGVAYLATLTGSGAGLLGAADFARQLVELAARRDLHQRLTEAADRVIETRETTAIDDAVAIVDAAMTNSLEMDRRRERASGASVQDAWDEAFDDMSVAADVGEAAGIRIDQYDDWNAVVGPLNPGDLVYLGGRPSMGKTGVAVKVMMGAAARMADNRALDGEPGAVDFFSLEMSRKPIMQRAIADAIFKSGETSRFDHLINGKMTSRDKQFIREMRQQIDGMPLYIHDPKEEMMVENFASEVRRRKRAWAARGRVLKMVIVDYLGRFGTLQRFQNDRDKVSHISRTLKSAAKQLGIALIVLCQLSRSLESREDKRPQLSDLRDSGSLEQDADVVAFVYRDQYYLERQEPPRSKENKWEAWDLEMTASRDRMELLGAKRRQGALVKRTGYFITDHQAVRSSEWRWGDDLFSFGAD